MRKVVDKVEEKESLHFGVYLFDDVAAELRVGNYNVSSNGEINCLIDEYFEQYEKEYNNKIQDIMLENGLREILDLQISDDELFKNILAGKYIFETDESRWNRANEYVAKNNLKVETFDITKPKNK